MYKNFLFYATILILCSCGSNSISPYVAGELTRPEKTKAVTVLVYMNGSDLENANFNSLGVDTGSEASKHIQEMLSVIDLGRVNLVLTTGGCKKVSPGPISSWKTVKRHLISEGQIREVADLGSVSMDDPKTLTDFLVWGQKTYPAQRTMVVMWDHGAGFAGFGGDQNVAGAEEQMRQPQLFQAFRQAYAVTGQKLDAIAFDACLMACDEIISGLAPYTDMVIASEELAPDTGLDYKLWLTALQQSPFLDSRELGKVICDSYLQKSARLQETQITMSVLDLRQYQRLGRARQQFAQALTALLSSGQEQTLRQLMFVRSQCRSFDQDVYVDVIDWMDKLRDKGLLLTEAAELENAARQLVVYSVHDQGYEFAQGLSICFPLNFVDIKDYDVYKAIDYPVFRDMVLQVVDYGKSLASNFNFTDIALSLPDVDYLNFKVTSSLGLRSLRLIGSSSGPPDSQYFYYNLTSEQAMAAVTDVSSLPCSLPTTKFSMLSWDGHLLPPPVSVSNGVILIPARIKDNSGKLKIRKFGMTYRLEGFMGEQGRVADIEDNYPIQPLQQVYDRSINKVVTIPFGSVFLAGAMQLTEAPVSPGAYHLAVEATDLLGHKFLSSAVISIIY